MTSELWRPIRHYEGYYEVSTFGRVRSVPRILLRADGVPMRMKGQILTLVPTPAGYRQVLLSKGGKPKQFSVHVLVLTTFLGDRPPGMVGCHGPLGSSVDSVDNLYWGTHSVNSLDRQRDGTDRMRNRLLCPRSHVLTSPNLVESTYKKNGRRVCKACSYAASYCRQAELKGEQLDIEAQAKYHYRRILARSLGLTLSEARQVALIGTVPLANGKLLPLDGEALLSGKLVA